MPPKCHFHSRNISTDRKFSGNFIAKSWKFSTENFCRRIRFYKISYCRKFSCVDTGLNSKLLCKKGYEGEFCEKGNTNCLKILPHLF